MDSIKLARSILLGGLVFFSILILGISGNLIGLYGGALAGIVPVFAGLNLAMAVITLVIVVPSLAIDFFRKGAFTSMVAFEIGWAGLLMIFWVAAAGTSSAQLAFLPVTCSFTGFTRGGVRVADTGAESVCRQEQAVEAFGWLNFFITLGWLITLTVLAATQHSRGNTSVWKKSVTSVDFRAPKSKSISPAYQNVTPMQTMQQQNTGYSQGYGTPQPQQMQPQNTGYSQGYPPANGYNNSNVAHV